MRAQPQTKLAGTSTNSLGGSGSSTQNTNSSIASQFIAKSDLGANWITALSTNLLEPNSFYTIGSEEETTANTTDFFQFIN